MIHNCKLKCLFRFALYAIQIPNKHGCFILIPKPK